MHQILLTAVAIRRGDPMTANILADALTAARCGGFCHTVVTTVPPVTRYLVEHSSARLDPYMERLIGAALEVRRIRPESSRSRRVPVEPLTAAELRVMKLLPTNTGPQIAANLYIARSTVKTHLQSVYRKLGVTSRSEAIERAVDMRLIWGRLTRASVLRPVD